MIINCLLLVCSFVFVAPYNNNMLTLSNSTDDNIDIECLMRDENDILPSNYHNLHNPQQWPVKMKLKIQQPMKLMKMRKDTDPMKQYQDVLHQFLFGHKADRNDSCHRSEKLLVLKSEIATDISEENEKDVDTLMHFPSGYLMHAELFENKSSVHIPPLEALHRGHSRLRITNDLMQTAVNAFAILLHGNLDDVMRLPADYVLDSARTIAMMKIAREKLAATWKVIIGKRKPATVSYITLEKYRPLFKYVNGREMAKLNLSDNRILTYIGTHAELNRHQVGVVASRYLKLNPRWSEPQYLNLLNNLLCGVPMGFMRKVFYHIRACDPLQRRFYLSMMTKTEVLGKSYSWSARDVSRLGILLAEVDGAALAAINPEAMSGITAQVMLEIPAESMQHFTVVQLRYLGLKTLNIYARKIKAFQDQLSILNAGYRPLANLVLYTYYVIVIL